jgi:hypothetical protein
MAEECRVFTKEFKEAVLLTETSKGIRGRNKTDAVCV